LANVYRVVRGSRDPLYLVDLPGYGYARGGRETARALDAVTQAYFERFRPKEGAASASGIQRQAEGGAILLVDARHPGLDVDRAAWIWLRQTVEATGIVATKTDKLSRAQRQRARRELEAVFEHPVVPVSAATGEGLDELWILIETLASQRSSNPPNRDSRPQPRLNPPKVTAPRPPKK
jgi:GTP-binding protein